MGSHHCLTTAWTHQTMSQNAQNVMDRFASGADSAFHAVAKVTVPSALAVGGLVTSRTTAWIHGKKMESSMASYSKTTEHVRGGGRTTDSELLDPPLTGDQTERLREALQMIASVSDELDSSATECGSCGFRLRANWKQHQTKLRLDGVGAKIGSVLDANLKVWGEKTRRRNSGTE